MPKKKATKKKPTVRPRPKKDRPKKPESYLKGVWRKYLNMKTSSGAPALSLGLMPLMPEKKPKNSKPKRKDSHVKAYRKQIKSGKK